MVLFIVYSDRKEGLVKEYSTRSPTCENIVGWTMLLLAVILDAGSVVPSCIREVHFKAGIFLVTLGGEGLMVHNLSLQLPSII